MSATAYLTIVQQLLTRYGMSTYVAFGNLGNLLTIAVFAQKSQRINPCSFYLLWMTICNLVCLDVGIIPIIFSLDHLDISTVSVVSCKLQFYVRHASFQMMRHYKVLACIDRFALSSLNMTIRQFSQYKVAKRMVIIGGIFWVLAVIFFAAVRTVENHSCNIFDDLYALIYTIYYMIFAGTLPPFLIMLFSLLVMRNLKQMRARITPSGENVSQHHPVANKLRKRDRDLLKMVLVEVLFYVLSTLPFSIFLVYKMITDDWVKSKERKQIETFINYMAQSFMMYFNTALPFYIYIFTSASFRKQTMGIFVKFYAFITGKPLGVEESGRTIMTMK
ncbi:unnamed protein product [Adineta ricciae]|uniref:G-protein coupled receptors family 1 profile domain-containing protein n=1 Tax=Adineta ricciae TaxID=249248 RepID=A0A816AW21_ADIRI|nr:unnamed protein product [Adineta ricciae]CAF1600771.1 unnamed protein product [Adineta ricciae]